jgi:hypothetical protein
VYGPSDHRDSPVFLDGLRELEPHISGVWLLAGDFNLVRGAADKNTGWVNTRLCDMFNATIESLGVVEVPLLDKLFTWSNRRVCPTLERLDRVFVNNHQCLAFPATTLTSLVRPTSDHTPLLITLSTSIPRPNTFRFENAWLRNQSFLPAVLPAWHEAAAHPDAAGLLAGCLKSTRAAAKVSARRNRAPPLLIQDCKFLILLCDLFEETRSLSSAELQLRSLAHDRLAVAIRERAAYWKQRGKQKAIREDDSNTNFFHAHATQRLRTNHIRGIEVNGTLVSHHQGKMEAVTAHFKQVMGTVAPCSWGFSLEEIYRGRATVSDSLTAEFTTQEALQAVRAMNKCSVPGPDGFGPGFYYAAWPTVKVQVMRFLQSFYKNEVDLERINRSYMVLLPKKPGAVKVTDFRPICLQNCSVKIAVELLTTRLQQQITELVDPNQTGFLKGRTISENFVFAAELVQVCYKRKVPTLVLKLDFAKAFDTVNWDSLMAVLRVRGFNDTWCSWIARVLSSSLTAVLVNGCPGPWFHCRRGLRQGDPMSPYLFLLVADVLQTLIQTDGQVRHPLADSPCTVLQYADDTLILLRGELQDVERLKLLLDLSSTATGLKINYDKSTAVPMHIPDRDLPACLQVLGCRQEGFPQTYLGLPLSCSKLKLATFDPYICKADRRLAGWQASLLNPMGRTVLINRVLDGQLSYIMSAMPLPPGSSPNSTNDAGDSSGQVTTTPKEAAALLPGTLSACRETGAVWALRTLGFRTPACCSS